MPSSTESKAGTTERISLRAAASAGRRALACYLRMNPGFAVWTIIYELLTAAAPYVSLYFSAEIVNRLSLQAAAGEIIRPVLLLLMLELLLTVAICAVNRLIQSRYRELGYYRLRHLYCRKLLSLPYEKYDDFETHNLLNEIQQNNNWLGMGVMKTAATFPKLVHTVPQIIGAVLLCIPVFVKAYGGAAAPGMTAAVLLGLCLLIFFSVLTSLFSGRAAALWSSAPEASSQSLRAFSYYSWDVIRYERALDVRLFNQGTLANQYRSRENRFGSRSDKARLAKGDIGRYNVLSQLSLGMVSLVAYALACVCVVGGGLPAGYAAQSVGALAALAGGISLLLTEVDELKANEPFLSPVFRFLHIGEDSADCNSAGVPPEKVETIEFRNVSFTYPGASAPALSGLSLTVKEGDTLALVGENGSGKSTFLKLLLGLYTPDSGEILVNGENIRSLDGERYRRLFSAVFQDFSLFPFTVRVNVEAGKPSTGEHVREAMSQAGLDGAHITPDTVLYKTLDDNGVEVSGGEAQKIAIARALYRDSPVLLLDEPTSALDPVAEAEIYSRFHEATQGRTTLFVSHRLASCRFCSRIAVFSGGRIAESGTHEELLRRGGKYSEFWNAQAEHYS